MTRLAHKTTRPDAAALPDKSRWGIPLLLAIAAVLMVSIHVPQHAKISPIDEYAYIDYVAKVPDQGFVKQGEKTGNFARHYLLCHGVAVYENFDPDDAGCRAGNSATQNDDGFPHGGRVTTDIYTPLYFVVAWAVGKGATVLGADLVDGARMSGALWLAAAAVLLFLGAVRLGASRSASAAVSLLMIASPLAYWSNTYVSTDATALFAGSLMLLLGLGIVQGRVRPWLFGLAAVVVTLLKIQNILAVGVMVLMFLLILARKPRSGSSTSPHRRSLTIAAVLGVVGPVAAETAWVVFRAASSVGQTPDQGVSSLWTPSRVLMDATLFFPGVMDTVNSNQDTGQFVVAWLLKLLIVGGVAAAIFAALRSQWAGQLALAALVLGIVAGPVLAFFFQMFSGGYVIPVSRYGAALVPAYLAVAAVLISQRRRMGLAALAVSVLVLSFSLVTFG